MPSTIPRVGRAVTALLGVVLLASTVFAPFGAVAWVYEYDVDRVAADDPQLASILGWPEKTASCSREFDACALAYRVRDGGPRVVSRAAYDAAYGVSAEKRLLIFRHADPTFYRPNVTHYENDSTRVALERVSNATALELASTPAHRFPSGVQRAVAAGRVRTDRPLTGFALWDHTHAVVAHDGAYYRQGSFTYRGPMTGVADLLRLVILAIGATLCYWAGRTG